jgi:hypothetical protein
MKLIVPPNPILVQWRTEELNKGNKLKTIRIQRVIDKRKYINMDTGKYSSI